MEFSIKDKNNYKVISLNGELDLSSTPTLKKEIYNLIDTGFKFIVIDMMNLKGMDSSGIALLANVKKKLKAEDGNFALLNVSLEILTLLRFSSLDKFFTILGSESEI
ncbi:MAG: STAS domain-containing protein [Leptospira sp.]|nr:STAS domain-containing protein [Leptospira sp.]